jgi:calcium/calmodulin-dependent protein kinase I
LLCGYTPFDRESNLEEMQAILVADYSFAPLEYWRGVSQTAREFIRRCLTIDPQSRLTAHEALQHPWINVTAETTAKDGKGEDLLPTVRKNFNARRTLHKAIDTVRAINKLREGGGLMMDGHMSVDPKPERVDGNKVYEEKGSPQPHLHTPPLGRGRQAEKGQSASESHLLSTRGAGDPMDVDDDRKVAQMVTGLWQKPLGGGTRR